MTSSQLNRGEALPSPVSARAIQFRGHDSEVGPLRTEAVGEAYFATS
jgi:hypothetical protein